MGRWYHTSRKLRIEFNGRPSDASEGILRAGGDIQTRLGWRNFDRSQKIETITRPPKQSSSTSQGDEVRDGSKLWLNSSSEATSNTNPSAAEYQ